MVQSVEAMWLLLGCGSQVTISRCVTECKDVSYLLPVKPIAIICFQLDAHVLTVRHTGHMQSLAAVNDESVDDSPHDREEFSAPEATYSCRLLVHSRTFRERKHQSQRSGTCSTAISGLILTMVPDPAATTGCV
jgi:hypothetical protein